MIIFLVKSCSTSFHSITLIDHKSTTIWAILIKKWVNLPMHFITWIHQLNCIWSRTLVIWSAISIVNWRVLTIIKDLYVKIEERLLLCSGLHQEKSWFASWWCHSIRNPTKSFGSRTLVLSWKSWPSLQKHQPIRASFVPFTGGVQYSKRKVTIESSPDRSSI